MRTGMLAVVLVSFGAVAAAAQPVYQCGPGNYSHQPCPGGRVVDATDPRSAAQRREAARVAARERQHAAALERERTAAARADKPAAAAPLTVPASAPATTARKAATAGATNRKRDASADGFTAIVPAKRGASKPAR